jgi:Na+-translocating ferredoxin:NAD+ oxidoreductase RnfG subunit
MVLRTFVLLVALAVPLGAHETGFPEETLKGIFPEATGFAARKKTFTAEQIKRIEQASGSKLQKNDNPLTFYVALGKTQDGSGTLGTVVLVDTPGPKGVLDLAVGFKRDGTVHRVLVVENKDDPGLSADSFLNQFKGKSAQSSFAVGKEIRFGGDAKSAEALSGAVRRAMHLLAAAQGK